MIREMTFIEDVEKLISQLSSPTFLCLRWRTNIHTFSQDKIKTEKAINKSEVKYDFKI